MAWPDDFSKINTNLTWTHLLDVIDAIDNEKVEWLEGELFMYTYSGHFIFRDNKYLFEEFAEVVSCIKRVSFEAEIVVQNNRKFDL